MKILVTNDDGIQSYGLKVLAEFAKTLGDVTVSAPKNPQSAKSHAITVHTPIEIEKVGYLDGVFHRARQFRFCKTIFRQNIPLLYGKRTLRIQRHI